MKSSVIVMQQMSSLQHDTSIHGVFSSLKDTNLFQSESDLIQARIEMFDMEAKQEPFWQFQMNVLPSDLCYRARNNFLNEEDTDAISQILDQLCPSVYQNRKRIPVQSSHWSIVRVQGGTNYVSEHIRDELGHKCLMTCYIFLNNGVNQATNMNENRFLGGSNTWNKPRTIEMPSIKGAAVVFDSSTTVSFGPVQQGCKYMLVANCMFDVLPYNYFMAKNEEISKFKGSYQMDMLFKATDELMTMRRALMKRSFNNCFDCPSMFHDANLDRKHHVLFECCQNCNSYIPVDSLKCQYCNDNLVPNYDVVCIRKKEGWVAL